ncbi:MAG: hypothetical protein KME25_27535 [Symplocastrum torsivum CPER-KK1]|jgi:hypothetical protein|uniref:Uncharacterized protein n=1 Tax=Symplocastrum torsivum CPER-KK1 TaxID=450513 RepID=A0A951PR39_9CYAN|nr:hypothetical protein [Symplocastrum torsivum CPER-KK1]
MLHPDLEEALELETLTLFGQLGYTTCWIPQLPDRGRGKIQWFTGLLQVLRVVTTDITQMTTLPSAKKGLSSYAIAPHPQSGTIFGLSEA